jgi:serralysin
MDFNHAEGDRIDLSGLDAIAGGVDDAFSIVGAFTGQAGELTLTTVTGGYQVSTDMNGDGVADFTLTVLTTTSLVAGDFLL